ncbi:MAG TPA: hypothetical protein VF587_00445 [Solirubrobacteraceae bacterium]|jgi:hypothetical protein
MGRRSRKRSASPAPAPERRAPAPAPRPPQKPLRRHAKLAEAPKAPWHPFPLVELSILAGLVLIVVGVVTQKEGGEVRTTFIFGGLALISLASLELAIREHFAGYRSHTMLLAGAVAVLVGVPLWFTTMPGEVILGIAALVGIVAFRALRSAFERRAEGMSWRA